MLPHDGDGSMLLGRAMIGSVGADVAIIGVGDGGESNDGDIIVATRAAVLLWGVIIVIFNEVGGQRIPWALIKVRY